MFNQTRYTDFQNTLSVSDQCPIEYGVPQGPVLDPLVSPLQINDIYNASEDGSLIFADDTNIFVLGNLLKEKVYSWS